MPERIEVSGLVNYGYTGEVRLPVPASVTARATYQDREFTVSIRTGRLAAIGGRLSAVG